MILALLWVAAHHGLRRLGAAKALDKATSAQLWGWVHDVTAALGFPVAPGGGK